MSLYLLLRDHIQSGPFSLEELKVAGVKATDLLWINGISTAWRYPEEIDELKAFIHVSSMNTNSAVLSNTTLPAQNAESSDNKIRSNGNGVSAHFKLQEVKIQTFEKKNDETDPYEEEDPDVRINIVPFTNRYPRTGKSPASKVDSSDSVPIQVPANEKKENIPDPSPLPGVIKVIIADDHTLFREGVKMALSQKKDVQIVGEAENGVQLLHMLKHNLPDVILLDIQMPIMDGIAALTSIRKYYSDIKVVMLSMYNDHSMVTTLLETGANAYLTKSADAESIYEAIKTCYSKSYYFNELTNISMLERIRDIKNIPGKNIQEKTSPEKSAVPKIQIARPAVKPLDFQKKPKRPGTYKISKQVLIATCSILLITTGIMAGISMVSHKTLKDSVLPKNPKQAESLSPTVNPAPDADRPSQPADTVSKTNVVNSSLPGKPVQEKNIGNNSSPEKTSPVPAEKKSLSDKHEQNENQNILKTATIPVIARTDSNDITRKVEPPKKTSSSDANRKALTIINLRKLVTVYANNAGAATPAELSNIKLTIYNQTYYKLDQVSVEVKYFLSNASLYKTEIMNFQGITSLSSKAMEIPKSPEGVRIEYKITSIKSKALDL